MKVPGAAWLEWRTEPAGPGQTRLIHRAIFVPRGLLGRLYWYAVVPFHAAIFARLAAALVARAEGGPERPPAPRVAPAGSDQP